MSHQQLPDDYLHLLSRDITTAERVEKVLAGHVYIFADGVQIGIPDENPSIRFAYYDSDVMVSIPEPDVTSDTDRNTFDDVVTFASLNFGTLVPVHMRSLDTTQRESAEQRLAIHQVIYAEINAHRTAKNQEAIDALEQQIGQEAVLPYTWHANPKLHVQRVKTILQQRLVAIN